MTNDGGGSGAPRFDVVLRGYDRRQVDEHVARMQRIIGRMRADLELARSQPLPIVQPAAGMPVEHSSRSAPRPRAHPGDSPDVVGSFTDRMQTILQSAEEEAAEIRKKAHSSARSELQAARAEVADLARQRDIMVTELNRLRGQLETMLSAPTAKMTPVVRNGSGTPSPTRRENKPRPSPTPRAGAAPSPVARQAATGPQQVPPPPPKPSVPDAAVTKAAPAVVDEKAPEPATKAAPKPNSPASKGPAVNGAAAKGASRNGADEAIKPDDAPPTTAVQVTGGPRGKANPARRDVEKPAAEPARAAAGDERPAVDATVRVAAVRPEKERLEPARPAEAEAHSSSRSG